MKKVTLLVLIAIVLGGCTKEKVDFRLPTTEIPIVTGFVFKDVNGQSIGAAGVPNIKPGDGRDHRDSKYYLAVYPNPTRDLLALSVKSPDVNAQKNVWMVEAYASDDLLLQSDIAHTISYKPEGLPVFQYSFQSRDLFIDVSSLKAGYYRLYMEVDGEIFYDNVVII